MPPELGDAEVEDLDEAVLGQEQVLGLEVPVDDALVVGGGEAEQDLDAVVDGLPHRQGAGGEPIAERLALEQLRHDVGCTVRLSDVVDDDDVGMVQRGSRLRLPLKAAKRL